MTSTNTMRKDVSATLKRLEQKDPGLRQLLDDAYGYAVFPSVGKAALVIGGSYGKGMVFEQGQPVGYATIAQTTLGVQVGGETFAEVIAFENKQALDRFKRGKIAFAANASAVLVKAGAAATADFEKGVAVFAYASGGMLLEAAIGGQKFNFKPLSGQGQQEEQEQRKQPQKQGSSAAKGASGKHRGGSAQEEEQDQDQGEDQDQEESSRGLVGRAAGGVKNATSKVTDLVKEHPVAATMIGVGLLGGAALLAARAMRSASSGSGGEQQDQEDESPEFLDEQDQGDQEQEDDEDDQMSGRAEEDEESDEYDQGDEDDDEGQEEDQYEEDEADEEAPTRARGRR